MKKKNQETKSKIREKINQIYEENEYANLIQNKNRSRSITVGTAFGGAVEVSMRGDYHHLWAIMQPVEVIELIEQLAAGVGLQVAMRPKQDFASWRGWDVDSDDRYWAGAAPWQIEDMSYTHRKVLKEQRESKFLPEETKTQKNKEELEIQEKLKKEIQNDVIDNIDNLRKELNMDFDEFRDFISNLDNGEVDEEYEEE